MSDEANTEPKFAFPAEIVTAAPLTLNQIWGDIIKPFTAIAPTNSAFIDATISWEDIGNGYTLDYNSNGILWRVNAGGIPHPDDLEKFYEQQEIIQGYSDNLDAKLKSNINLNKIRIDDAADISEGSSNAEDRNVAQDTKAGSDPLEFKFGYIQSDGTSVYYANKDVIVQESSNAQDYMFGYKPYTLFASGGVSDSEKPWYKSVMDASSGIWDGFVNKGKELASGIYELAKLQNPVEQAKIVYEFYTFYKSGEFAKLMNELEAQGITGVTAKVGGTLYNATIGDWIKRYHEMKYAESVGDDCNTYRIATELGIDIGLTITIIRDAAKLTTNLPQAFRGLSTKEAATEVNIASREKIPWGSWNDYEKVIMEVDGKHQTYAKVGDRLYSRHAVDRMQPSGFRYREEGAEPIRQAGGSYDYGRSVSPEYVEIVLKNATPVPSQGLLSYRFGDLEIITNDIGAVVTIMYKH
ncbi:hypothetical protein SPSIL_002490 [Sporomusa silvacetica DSM 10669]|uniref:Uncharacterized protein n=1 Tax=Sporomusa silvacetica DSM 10669 TaxID=1123289 RepID=A0ABZ3IEN2_9FIRM|nr:hypothetical protein SPSIL_29890 [Sporomusa silvacetica DSM 10669]